MKLTDEFLLSIIFSFYGCYCVAIGAGKSGYPGTGLARVNLMGIYETQYYIQSRQAASINWTSDELMCTGHIAKVKIIPLDDLLPPGAESNQFSVYYSCSPWYYCCEFECCKYRMGMAASGLVILICFLLCVCIFGIHNCLVEKRPNEEPQIVVDVVREEEIDFSNSSDYNQFKSEYPLNGKNRGERHIHFRSYDSQSEYPTNV